MISLKLASALQPKASARSGAKSRGQPSTIFSITGSGCGLIRRTTSLPATSRRASICSATVQLMPGRLSARRPCSNAVSSVAAWAKNPAAERGLANQWRVLSAAGKMASCPFSGSRMMPEKNEDAAAFGLPGRTQIVGRRIDTPSMNPLREKSVIMVSQISFCAP